MAVYKQKKGPQNPTADPWPWILASRLWWNTCLPWKPPGCAPWEGGLSRLRRHGCWWSILGSELSHECRSTPGEHVAPTLDEQASRVFCCGLHGHLQLASLLCSLPHSFPSLPRPRPSCSSQEALLLSLKQPYHLFPAPSPAVHGPHSSSLLLPATRLHHRKHGNLIHLQWNLVWKHCSLPFNVYPQYADAACMFIIHF